MPSSTELLERAIDTTVTELQTIVKGKDDPATSWKEVADINSVSASGAGFVLSRPCEIGRLISLVLPQPPHLRCYDHEKELYAVWGLVQHCYKTSSDADSAYQIGVAFVGKDAPESYLEDPTTSYRISGMSSDGLWKITETKGSFKKRRHMRYWKAVDLYLALVDIKEGSLGGERTTTENISRSGAAVFSKLDINVGDRVKFISEQYDFSGLAVVCNRQDCGPDRARLHLQFVNTVFPVDRLDLSGSELHS